MYFFFYFALLVAAALLGFLNPFESKWLNVLIPLASLIAFVFIRSILFNKRLEKIPSPEIREIQEDGGGENSAYAFGGLALLTMGPVPASIITGAAATKDIWRFCKRKSGEKANEKAIREYLEECEPLEKQFKISISLATVFTIVIAIVAIWY